MKILIHALGATMGGAVRHLTNFLPELGQADPRNEYVVLTREGMRDVRVAPNTRLELLRDADIGGWLRRIYGDTVEIPRKLRRENYDVVVSLMNFGPIWSPVPHVIFQRNSVYFCRSYLEAVPVPLKVDALARRRLAAASMTRSALVVTPTDAMRDMIHAACPGTRRCRFTTLRHGFERAEEKPLDASLTAVIGAAVGTKLLYPSHPGYHKGFDILFQTLATLHRRGRAATLFLTMERADRPELIDAYERQLTALGVRDRVVFMGRVPQAQMPALYKQFDLMVYPSICESFGFGLVEAMGAGLPIVASGTATNREVCGDAASYYRERDAADAADQIERALPASARGDLAARGAARIAGYDWGWRRYAHEFVSIVHEAAHATSGSAAS